MSIIIGDLLVKLAAENNTGEFLDALAAVKARMQETQAAAGQTGQALNDFGNASQQAAGRFTSSWFSIEGMVTRFLIRDALREIISLIGQTAGAFEDAAAQITAATGQIGDGLAAYTDGLRQLSDAAGQTALDVGKAMGAVSSAFSIGPGDDLQAVTKDVLDLSKITGDSATTIADDMAKVSRAFNLIDVSDIESAMNRLLTVAQDSHIKFSTLANDITQFQGLWSGLGIGVDNAAQAIGRINSAGLNVTQTLGQMQTAMSGLAKNGAPDAADAMRQLFDMIARAPTTADAFDIAAKSFKGNSEALAIAIRDTKITFDDFYGTLDPLNAKLSDQAKSMADLKDAWQQFKNQISDGEIGLLVTNEASQILQALNSIAAIINEGAKDVANYSSNIKEFALALSNPVPGLSELVQWVVKLGVAADEAFDKYKWILLTNPATAPLAMAGIGLGMGSNQQTQQGPAADASFVLGGSSIQQFGAGTPYANASGAKVAADYAALLQLVNGTGGSNKTQLPQNPQVQYLERAIKLLQEDMGGKNDIDALWAQYVSLQEDFTQQMIDLNKKIAAETLVIQTKQKFGAAVSDQAYNNLAVNQYTRASASMDQASAEKLLGIPDPVTVGNNIALIQQAFDKLQASASASPDFIAIAWANATAKILADARSIGDATDQMVLNADFAKVTAEIQNMDLGTARSALGLTTVSQAYDQVSVAAAAYEEILKAVAEGNAAQQDANNAELDLLTKQQSAMKSVGNALDDVSQARLNYLQAQKDMATLNSDSAFKLLGVASQADLDNALSKLEDALNKALSAKTQYDVAAGGVSPFTFFNGNNPVSVGQSPVVTAATPSLSQSASDVLGFSTGSNAALTQAQQLVATFNELDKELQQLRSTGAVVTSDFLDKWASASADAKAATTDFSKAMSDLGTISIADASRAIAQLNVDLDAIKAKFGANSAEYLTATAAALAKTISLTQQSGQAVAQAISDAQQQVTANVKATTNTLAQAYADLGVTSAQSAAASEKVLFADLAQVQNDAKANEFTIQQASVAAWTKYYQDRAALGEAYDKQDAALIAAEAAAEKNRINDSYNAWKNLSTAIADVYKSVQTDLASGITGLINGTTTVSAAFLKMGQDVEQIIVTYVIKNFILTQNMLDNMTVGVQKFFSAWLGGAAGSAGGGTGNAAATFAQDGTTAAMSGGGGLGQGLSGLVSSLGGVASAISLIGVGVEAISGIVQGIQNAHIETLLSRIEQSTRYTWIATGEASDSISQTNIGILQKTGATLDFLNGDLRQYLQNINIDLDALSSVRTVVNLSASFDFTPVINQLQNIERTLIGIQDDLELIGLANAGTAHSTAVTADVLTKATAAAAATTTTSDGNGSNGMTSALLKATRDLVTVIGGTITSGGTVTGATSNPYSDSPGTTWSVTNTTPAAPYGSNPSTVAKPVNLDPTVQYPITNLGISGSGLGVGGASTVAGGTINAVNSIWNQLTGNNGSSMSQLQTQINQFLSLQNESMDQFMSSIDTTSSEFGKLGITMAGVNAATNGNLSQADFNAISQPAIIESLVNALRVVGVGANPDHSYTADQVSSIQADFLANMTDWLDNTVKPNLANFTGIAEGTGYSIPSGPAPDVNQVDPNAVAAGTQAYTAKTYSTVAAQIVGDFTGGLMAAAPTFAAAVSTAASDAATMGVASVIDPNSYTGRYLASEKAGFSLPASAIVAGSSTNPNPNLALDSGNPNSVGYNYASARQIVVNINGSQFPQNMTPQQVASALADVLRTQTALLR